MWVTDMLPRTVDFRRWCRAGDQGSSGYTLTRSTRKRCDGPNSPPSTRDRCGRVGPNKECATGSYTIYRVVMRGNSQRYAVRLYPVTTPEQGHSDLGLEVQRLTVGGAAASEMIADCCYGSRASRASSCRRSLGTK
jgi:hypothetical protein